MRDAFLAMLAVKLIPVSIVPVTSVLPRIAGRVPPARSFLEPVEIGFGD